MIARLTGTLACALLLAAPALAQEEADDQGPWSGKIALGYLATSGNTESTSLNTAAELGLTHGNWSHLLDMTAIFAEENDTTNAEAYKVGWKSEYNFSEHDFLFGRAIWRKDRFSGYDQQFSQTVGYGRRLIDTERHKLSAEIGAGARQSDLADGTSENDTILRGGLQYRLALSETSLFSQDLSVESGSTNVYTESVTALKTRLLNDLALVASYTIKNNSDVPVGLEKTDTYTALSLEYAF